MLKSKRFMSNKNFKRYVIFACTFIIMYSILATSLIAKRYNLSEVKENEIAKVNIKAPREIQDDLKTQEKIQNAVDKVAPIYSKSTEVKSEVVSNVNAFFIKVQQQAESADTEAQKIDKLSNDQSIKLSKEQCSALLKLPRKELIDLPGPLTKAMGETLDGSIENNDAEIKKAQDTASLKFEKYAGALSTPAKDVAREIIKVALKPNFILDEKLTEEAQNEQKKKVVPEVIKKDQIIVKEGEPVTKYQIEILKSLGLLNYNSKFQWNIYISLAFFVLLVLSLQWYYLYKNCREIFEDFGKIVLINLLNCIALTLARFLNLALVPFLIPLAYVPMLLALLINDKVSLSISILNSILISATVGFNIEITLLAISSSLVSVLVLKKMQQRNDILYSSLYLAIINVVLTFAMGFLLSNNVLDVVQKALFSFIASGISAVLTIGSLPLFESTFDIVTTIKLLELSNPNNPLLKKLLMEAPGTYHHSILVANLAEVATEEVGGNPVIARTAAYYHDIGKIKRPYFFKENQLGNDNPHNKITPNLSTLIITSHVKDGVELAKEQKLPKVIQDIIEQHHGTSLVKYFYVTMKNSSENPDEINEEDFKYLGPIPSTKEAGIIMLADCIEASVRSINDPTKGKIEEMVNKIIKDRLNEGQLDNCDLTLKDLDKIRKAFLKVLSGIYHQRIEYPVDKWKDKNIKGLDV